jgi:acetyl esterase/lipase
MNHRTCLALLLSIATLSAAEQPAKQTLSLWPKGAPGNEPKLEAEKDTTKDTDNNIADRRLIRLGNVTDPTITLYPAPKEKAHGGAVLVCPGGAYNILALDLEGTEVCERLNEMGFTAVLLKYRVPRRPGREKHAAPLEDAQRAISLIRQHASEWSIDPQRIGVLGFSAGGHLAAVLSAGPQERTYEKIDDADTLSSKPNFTVLIYPGYLTAEKNTTTLAPEFVITKETPQTFIAMTADDPVHVENALVYASALQKEKVPFELHIYPTGGHGYGLRKTKDPVTTWPERLEEWFTSRNLNKK